MIRLVTRRRLLAALTLLIGGLALFSALRANEHASGTVQVASGGFIDPNGR